MSARRFSRKYPPVTVDRPQAKQAASDGQGTVYRWYLWMTDRKLPAITWAATADEAAKRRCFVHTVEPAPDVAFIG